MISIFNGRERKLGGSTSEVYAQVNVDFRQHLYILKGAKLAVFLAISLHANEHGWAWPGRSLLAKETGYNTTTVSITISELCKIKINGQRILLRLQPNANGVFDSNNYLIFPSPNEVAQYESMQLDLDLPCTGFPYTVEPYTVKSYTVEPYTVNPYTNYNHSKEGNDDDDKNRPDTALPTIEKLYTEEIGEVTPSVHLYLTAMTIRYPDLNRWHEAFDGVTRSNVRRLDYLMTCLKNVGKAKTVKPK